MTTKASLLRRAGILALTLLVGACSSAVGAIVGAETVTCSVSSGSTQTSCTVSRNIPNSDVATVQNECTNNHGTLVTACPTKGLVGCCTQTQSVAGTTVSSETCTYAGTAAQVKSQCSSGTFSTTE